MMTAKAVSTPHRKHASTASRVDGTKNPAQEMLGRVRNSE
jgi:hypothetical protein